MTIDGFTLLRPEALWLLLLVIPATVALWRLGRTVGTWAQVIDPALLPHLIEETQGSTRRRGHGLIAAGLCLAILAMAGPSGQQIEVPVFQRADALVIVLDLSASMAAADVQPSRAQRARQKIRDLLADRVEGVTGMVVYAGDAHVVAPLTDDRRTIENLLPSLDPGIMPLPGSDAAAAIELATTLLGAAGAANGQILLLTDGMPKFDANSVRNALTNTHASLAILGVGTPTGAPIPRPDGGFIRHSNGDIVVPRLEIDQLERIAGELNGIYRTVSLDNTDIEALRRGPALTDTGDIELNRQTDTWLDQGNWLALALALAILPLFRRGLLALCLLIPLTYPESAAAQDIADLWQTPDQQGAAALAAGNAAEAASLFEDAQWRGAAAYQAEDWQTAVDSFSRGQTADSYYNQGNALARAGQLQQAIEAYDQSLALSPDQTDAINNRALIQQLLEQQQQENADQESQDDNAGTDSQDSSGESDKQDSSSSEEQQTGDSQSKESQSPGEDGDRGQDDANPQQSQSDNPESGQQDGGDSSATESRNEALEQQLQEDTQAQMAKFDEALEEQQALEQWLRRVPDDPGGLLRRKFRYESIQRLRKGEEPDEDVRW